LSTREVLKNLDEFEKTPESDGYDLRLDLAEIILRNLDRNGCTQSQFAEKAKMKAPQLTRLIHAATNWTADTAGRITHALGIKTKLVEVIEQPVTQCSSNPSRIWGEVGPRATKVG